MQELHDLLSSTPGWKCLAGYYGSAANVDNCLVGYMYLREGAAKSGGRLDVGAAHARVLQTLGYRRERHRTMASLKSRVLQACR